MRFPAAHLWGLRGICDLLSVVVPRYFYLSQNYVNRLGKEAIILISMPRFFEKTGHQSNYIIYMPF